MTPKISQVPESLLSLMDDLTPYYRRQLSFLSAQQRKVLCCLARNGTHLNSTQIAKESRLDPRISSMALTRLKKKGYVNHHNRVWELSDPWLGFWYRLRRCGPEDLNVPENIDPPVSPSIIDSLLLTSGESIQKLPANSKWESDLRRVNIL